MHVRLYLLGFGLHPQREQRQSGGDRDVDASKLFLVGLWLLLAVRIGFLAGIDAGDEIAIFL